MEFSYYFDLTPISSDSLLELWEYNAASTSGNFTSNSSSNATLTSLADTENLEDFTCLLIFNKNLTNAQILLSNYNGTNGWTVGITANNFLFVDSRASSETHIFRGVNLGNKNCIGIKKSSNSFSVYKFDLVSDVIESSESYFFNSTTNLENSSTIKVGGNSNYVGAGANNAVNYFNGTIEQFAFLNIPLEDSYILDLVEGFQPRTLLESSSTSFVKLDEVYRYPNSSGTFDSFSFLHTFFNSLNTGIISNLNTGKWLGYSSGSFNNLSFVSNSAFSTGLSSCYGTGSYYSSSYSTSSSLPSYTDTTTFYDTIRVVRGSGVISISHNFAFSGAHLGSEQFYIDYDSYYNPDSTTYSRSFSIDTSYYTGFKMQGVVSDKAKMLVLGTDTGNLPSTYNQEGIYNNLTGRFFLDSFSNGNIYYDGTRLSSSGYTSSDGYIDVTGVVETSNDYIIYDNSTGLTLIYLGIKNHATGDFYPNASIVFSGQNSISGVYRMSRADYKETCRNHLYHNSEVQDLGSDLFFTL